MVRAKMRCTSNASDGDTAKITLDPVIGESEENKRFYKYTPGGSISLQVVNAPAASYFTVGQEYYVDFTAA